jgi:hypothetical protein
MPKGDPCPACPADDQRTIATRERCMRCYQREWRAANPGKARAYQQDHADRRAAAIAAATLYPAPLGPPRISLAEASYHTVHHRLAALRGPAREHTCACGRPAAEWAYTPQPGLEQWRRIAKGKPLPRDGMTTDAPYSLHPADYAPSCHTCHRAEWHQARRDLNATHVGRHGPDLPPKTRPRRRPLGDPPLWADRAARRDRTIHDHLAAHPTWHATKFAVKIEPQPDGCHLWTGHRDRNGYGTLHIPGAVHASAHRVNYLASRGPIPHGHTLDHLCRNPGCVNPDHLRAVSQHTNLHASPDTPATRNAAKSHCPKGHPYDGDNLIVRTTTIPATGRTQITRSCRTCAREKAQEAQALLTQARHILGLTSTEYAAQYGRGIRQARRIIDTTT